MIFRAIVSASALGFLYGFFNSFANCISRGVSHLVSRWLILKKGNRAHGGLIKNAFDFFTLLLCGVLFLLSNYVFLDGTFNLYSLVFLILTALVSKLLFAKLLSLSS